MIQSRDCKTDIAAVYLSGTLLTLNRSKGSKSSFVVFNGLDTFTTVELCGQIIGTTNNQFRQYTFDISDPLSNCIDNAVLSLNFGSAPKIVNDIAEDPNSQSMVLNQSK